MIDRGSGICRNVADDKKITRRNRTISHFCYTYMKQSVKYNINIGTFKMLK